MTDLLRVRIAPAKPCGPACTARCNLYHGRVLVTVAVSPRCPRCGVARGVPVRTLFQLDGAPAYWDVLPATCEHRPLHRDLHAEAVVLAEAAAAAAAAANDMPVVTEAAW